MCGIFYFQLSRLRNRNCDHSPILEITHLSNVSTPFAYLVENFIPPFATYMARPGWEARRVGLGVLNSYFHRRRLCGGEETPKGIVEVRI